MRLRFFWTILFALFIVVIMTTSLHHFFLKQEKLRSIDQQVREAASALLDSELGGLRSVNIEKVEEILSEELGENRIGKFFIIRNGAGDILFESASAQLLPVEEVPQDERWVTLTGKGQFIRVLNLSLPRINDRKLQVGIVIDENLVTPTYFSTSNLIFSGIIVFIALGASWLLASSLIKPISLLSKFIDSIADNKDGKLDLPSLPKNLEQFLKRDPSNKDELSRLLIGFEKLIERVNKGYKGSKLLSYQMAHELKTPLAVIESIVNDAAKSEKLDSQKTQMIMDEIFAASETITAFLTWAEVENNPSKGRIHVVKISRELESIEQRLNHQYKARIQLKIENDFSILTNLDQLDQVIENLVSNACNYSPTSRQVIVEAKNYSLRVIDQGNGIPESVLSRMGQPFNKGESSHKGSGLGLAYVQSVCKQAGWKLDISSNPQSGTIIEITFPTLKEESITSSETPLP